MVCAMISFSPFEIFQSCAVGSGRAALIKVGTSDRRKKGAGRSLRPDNLPVTKLAHEYPRSETSTITYNEINHIQHEVHSFLFVFCIIAPRLGDVKVISIAVTVSNRNIGGD